MWMVGIHMDGPVFVIRDNHSVLCNTSMPVSSLKKKLQHIAYHFVCEGCAIDVWRTNYICVSLNLADVRTNYIRVSLNLADVMTKPLSGEKKWGFIRMPLHHI
jgi:hypothetical protein